MVWIDDGPRPDDAGGHTAARRVDGATPLDAFALLGACATRTSTIGLGTLATPVTARRPAVLAKVATTLDVISRGRAVLGIGVGASDARAAERLAEGVAICRGLLADEEPTMAGDFFRVDGAPNRPGPLRPGGIPITVDTVGLSGEDVAVVLAPLVGGPTAWPAGLVVRDGPPTATAIATATATAAGDRAGPAVTTIRVLSGEAGPTAPGMVADELASALAEGFDAVAVPLGVLVDEDAGDDEVAGAVGAVGAAAAGTVRAC